MMSELGKQLLEAAKCLDGTCSHTKRTPEEMLELEKLEKEKRARRKANLEKMRLERLQVDQKPIVTKNRRA